MKTKHIPMYMEMAFLVANQSYCERKKVGCVVVSRDDNILIGYNGTAAGMPNVCEVSPEESSQEVLHAEANAFSKALKNGTSVEGAVMFITLSPCLHCAKMIVQSGVASVLYVESYRDTAGVDYLKRCGVEIYQVDKTGKLVS